MPISVVVKQNSRFDGNDRSQTKAPERLVVGRDLPTGTANRAISAVTLGILRVGDNSPAAERQKAFAILIDFHSIVMTTLPL